MSQKTGIWCSYFNCMNNSVQNLDLRFFRFPKDKIRCNQWILNSGCLDFFEKENYVHYCYNNRRICSIHFAPEFLQKGQTRTMLRNDAIPEKCKDYDFAIPSTSGTMTIESF